MTQTVHASFTVEDLIAAAPARVFHAYSDATAKAGWFPVSGETTFDFRAGGSETNIGGPEGGPVYGFYARYHDIVPNERIVSTYEMTLDGQRISVSLVTTEFKPEGEGTRVVHTEHGVFLEGLDQPDVRQGGTQWLLGALKTHLEGQAQAAA